MSRSCFIDECFVVAAKVHECDDTVLAWLEGSVCVPAVADFHVTCMVEFRVHIWQVDGIPLGRDLREDSLEVVKDVLARLWSHTEHNIINWNLMLIVENNRFNMSLFPRIMRNVIAREERVKFEFHIIFLFQSLVKRLAEPGSV